MKKVHAAFMLLLVVGLSSCSLRQDGKAWSINPKTLRLEVHKSRTEQQAYYRSKPVVKSNNVWFEVTDPTGHHLLMSWEQYQDFKKASTAAGRAVIETSP